MMRGARLMSALVFGLVVAAAVIWFGPKYVVVCTEASWPNSMFGDQFGHYDSAISTGCDVPTLGAWMLALVVAVGLPLVVWGLERRSHSTRVSDGQ